MDNSKRRYFIALLPPQEIRTEIQQIQQYFADFYDSRAAFRSPPHITLQPPFEWLDSGVSRLEACLKHFAAIRSPFEIQLSGFAAFVPRVIYLNVIKTPALLGLQAELLKHLETTLAIVDPQSQQRPYVPHITVAYRDLTRQNFQAAWPEFRDRRLEFEFSATELTLLIHDGKQWQVQSDFPFQSRE